MKKLTAILSILFVIGLVHQEVIFAGTGQSKKAAKSNFNAKKKHAAGMAAPAAPVAPAVTTPAPTPVESPTV